jgi:predicted secreted protein
MKLTNEDNGKTITLTKDDSVTVILKGNPSTGYVWLDNGTTAGEVEGVEYINEEPENTFGGPVTIKYKIKIEKQGEIKLAYCRPWCERATALKSFEVNVQL